MAVRRFLCIIVSLTSTLGVCLTALGCEEESSGLADHLEALGHENPDVRNRAAQAIRECGATATPALVSTLRHDQARARGGAANILGESSSTHAAEAITVLLKDDDAEVRRSAARALGRLGVASTVDSLAAALRDATPSVREATAIALGRIGSHSAARALVRVLSDSDEVVVRSAREALLNTGVTSAVSALMFAENYTDARPGNAMTVTVHPTTGILVREFLEIAEWVTGAAFRLRDRKLNDQRIFLDVSWRLPVTPESRQRARFFRLVQTVLYRLKSRCVFTGDLPGIVDGTTTSPRWTFDVSSMEQEGWVVTNDQSATAPSNAILWPKDKKRILAAIPILHLTTTHAATLLRDLSPDELEIGRLADADFLILQGVLDHAVAARDVLQLLDVPPEQAPERVATGFGAVDGPAWDTERRRLLFSDTRSGEIMQLRSARELEETVETDDPIHGTYPAEVYLRESHGSRGMAFDAEGNRYACATNPARVTRIAPGGEATTLARQCLGEDLNGPIDLALDNAGGLYFTDASTGAGRGERGDRSGVAGVYYVSSTRAVTLVIDDLERPHGLLVARDGSALYVSDPAKGEIHHYPIAAPGQLGEGQLFFRPHRRLDESGPFGMAMDENRNIYVACHNLLVVSPVGKLVRRIPMSEPPTNVVFGGEHRRTLFITAGTSLYRKYMGVRGSAVQTSFPKSITWRQELLRMIPEDAGASAAFAISPTDAMNQLLGGALDAKDREEVRRRFQATNALISGNPTIVQVLIATFGRAKNKPRRDVTEASMIESFKSVLEPRLGIIFRKNERSPTSKRIFSTNSPQLTPQWACVFWWKKKDDGAPESVRGEEFVHFFNQHRRAFGITGAYHIYLGIDKNRARATEFAIPDIPGTGSISMCVTGRNLIVGNDGQFIASIVKARTAAVDPDPGGPAFSDGHPWVDDEALLELRGDLTKRESRQRLASGDPNVWIRFAFGY